MRLNVNTREFHARDKKGNWKGSFFPDRVWPNPVGSRANPWDDWGDGVYSALLIVGLRDQHGRDRDPEEVVRIVRELRLQQSARPGTIPEETGDPGSSFLLQRGLYRHERSGEIMDEEGVRVIILLVKSPETRDQFKENILHLGETLARELDQESVIVEFQDKGVTDKVYGARA